MGYNFVPESMGLSSFV